MLSANSADPSGKDKGMLYVPDLDSSDYCYNASKPYVPRTVTRQQNLPKNDDNLIAIAPWFDANCTQSYLASARLDPIRGFIFYLPNYADDHPPSISSPEWDLGDQGHWKYVNEFPIYAVSSSHGQEIMGNLSLYSGNMTKVPNGHILANEFGARNYARIRTVIDSNRNSALHGLWLFILVVVGALVVSVTATSFGMHMVQRRRRSSLRHRIINGQVDLEALGIKRLTVPMDVIDKMPLYLYTCTNPSITALATNDLESSLSEHHPTLVTLSHPSESVYSKTVDMSVVQSSHLDSTISHEYLRYSQPTCPICLDDFISHQTVIRELHCGHIYHPDCVDGFLSKSSSLCPMCKKSVLPRGYCPDKITNAMVRRERQIRKLRSRISLEDDVSVHSAWTHRLKFWGDTLGRRTVLSTPSRAIIRPGVIQMEETTVIPQHPEPLELRHLSDEGYSRQEIIQQRVQQLLAGPTNMEDQILHEESLPLCKSQDFDPF